MLCVVAGVEVTVVQHNSPQKSWRYDLGFGKTFCLYKALIKSTILVCKHVDRSCGVFLFVFLFCFCSVLFCFCKYKYILHFCLIVPIGGKLLDTINLDLDEALSCRRVGEGCRGLPSCCNDLKCYWESKWSFLNPLQVSTIQLSGVARFRRPYWIMSD